MAKIRVMSEALANKIAAGEVVERPASVVKELVENAIDAEASRIAVELQGAGCRTIRVVDNGTGMEEDDVLLALERHATSKVHSDADLVSIYTLGFRGEALPSLAAVSRLELSSRTREATSGTCVQVTAGVVREVSRCGCAPGTQVWVRDLFFNQPARRKFLKKERTELGQVVDTLTRLAFARADIHFSLHQRNRLVHDWPAAADLRQRLAQIFPKGLTQSWLDLSHRQEPYVIRGYLGPPELHRSNSRMLFLYVNGRAVRDRLLHFALAEAYRTLLPKGQFPLGVLFVELPAHLVDVNVHPTKGEVRFQDPRALGDAVTRAAQRALAGLEKQRWTRTLATSSGLPSASAPIRGREKRLWEEGQRIAEPLFPTYAPLHAIGMRSAEDGEATKKMGRQAKDQGAFSGGLTVIGQLLCAYILCEAPDGLILIDQHAAHERVLFEAFRGDADAGSLASQGLTIPMTIETTAEEASWLGDSLTLFGRLGFRLDHFGSHTFVVREVPAMALGHEPLVLLQDLVAAGCGGKSRLAPADALESLLQAMACRMAIKAGQSLVKEEMVALLHQLDGLDSCSTCPHGRPLWWKLSITQVERIFGRT